MNKAGKFIAVITFTLFILTGCSSQFAYNNLDWLVHWYLDDYVDLDRNQKQLFNGKMGRWLSWHKKEELPAYEEHLRAIKAEINAGSMSEDTWSRHFEQGYQHWVRLRNTISPDLVELSTHLRDEQIITLFDELEEKDKEKEEDWSEGTDEEKLEKRISEMESNIKEWTGRLSSEQKSIIARHAPLYRSSHELWMQYRRQWQAAARELLLNKRHEPGFTDNFLYLLTHPEDYQSQEYQDNLSHNKQIHIQLIVAIRASLSDKQLKHVNRKLDNLIEDLVDLQE